MFRNYLKIAFRSLFKNKVYSIINIFGLAISLTGFILMVLYLESEWKYDRFHSEAENIYRVADDKQTPEVTLHNASSAAPVAPALLADFPEIKAAIRLLPLEMLMQQDDKLFQERSILAADDRFFDIFSFNLLQGNAATALKEPNSIVLTEAMAQKYFGNTNPIGSVILGENIPFKVTGVVQNVPANSHFTFDFLISMATVRQEGSGYDWLFTNWYSDQFYTYILLPEKYDASKLSTKLTAFDERHDEADDNTVHHYALEKLTNIYLYSDRENQIGKTGSIGNLYVFSIVALFILIIACINFVTLATARASERAKEVGIKKVAGANKRQLVTQFLTDSSMMTAISIVIAMLLVHQIIPLFNQFSGKSLDHNFFTSLHLVLLFCLFVIVSLLSGAYPAMILSSFSPVLTIKNSVYAPSGNVFILKGLVILQFAISIALIVGTIVVNTQLKFMQKYELGFKPSQTLVIDYEGDDGVQEKYDVIRQELLNIQGVKSVAGSSAVPGDGNISNWSMNFIKTNGDTLRTELPLYIVDHDFPPQYNISIIGGRSFSKEYPADGKESVLISETALEKLGFSTPEEAIGVKVGMYPNEGSVIGVFKDFHFESLQKEIQPLVMRIFPFGRSLFSVELDTKNIRQTVAAIEKEWKILSPQRPLAYFFLDENFNEQYNTEMKFGQVMGVFSILAIFIACLGLFGLALFSVQKRTKEIGIRKVLGAPISDIVTLLSKEFFWLVFIAFFIAAPISWYAMNQWLQDFAYRINTQWWMFVLAGVAALGIALLTVSFQAIRAATANPVESLKNE